MIVDLKDYIIAAILIDIVEKDHSGFTGMFDVRQFNDEFERVYGAELPESLLANSVSKLVELGGGKVISDPFTRDYIYLDSSLCGSLFYDAEGNTDTVVGRACLLGKHYINEALSRILDLDKANLLEEFYDFDKPNRYFEVDHDDENAKAIDTAFDKLENQLETSNESSIALGESLELAKQEISALRQRWRSTKIRVASFVNQAQQSLVWLMRESGKTAVSQTAKRLYDLILNFF